MKTIVVYCTKSGFTEKYARWISESLACDIITMQNAMSHMNELESYECVIFGGGIYGGTVRGIDFIQKNTDFLAKRHTIVFSTGATEVDEKELQKIRFNNKIDELPHFHMHSGLDYSKMTFGDKVLLSTVKMMLKSQKNPEALAKISTSFDECNVENIEPLITHVKNLQEIK